MTSSPTQTSGPRTVTIHANGLDFWCLESGTGPLVLCLHGFPDTPWGFRYLVDHLAKAGYRAVAPVNRGYAPGAMPAEDDFFAATLARDALAIMDALGAPTATIIGHDWGAATAYALAEIAPERVESLVAMSVPPTPIARPTRTWLSMVLLFQLTGVAGWLLRRNGGTMIKRIYRGASPQWRFADEDTAPARQAACAPRGTWGMLGPYRALFKSMRLGTRRSEKKSQTKQLPMPALLILGDADPVFPASTLDHFAKVCSSHAETLLVAGAGHFPHRERPKEVASAITDFLRTAR
jgi:pimeloyl-ACP methyl ester carboxylesterase